MKNISPTPDPQLLQFRASLDNLDQALVCLLAERFRITRQVGLYKRDHGLDIQDVQRETSQLKRIQFLAGEAGLDPQFAAKLLRSIIDETLKNHKKLQEETV